MNHKFFLLALSILASASISYAQIIDYKGEAVQLGPKAFYVDGSLSEAKAAESKYVFNSFNEAMAAITDGTELEPMKVYIAPWVYWVDDPDDPQIRRKPDGSTPIGLTIRCEHLQLLGICSDPRDVVLACARGQSQGSYGNFTMFDFYGNDLVVKDLTMGNYCNIDLEYPRDPRFNRAKRNSAITQAQLAFCHGDRVYVENVRFMARLNLCPLVGAKRILFVDCHMECTDDSLTPTGVYLRCDVDEWGSQPFGTVSRFGTVFLDSDFHIRHSSSSQAVSKDVGRHSLIDCRYHSGRPVHLAWTLHPEEWLRCYQYNITLDGNPAFVGAQMPYNTVTLDDKQSQLGAYRLIEDDGSVLYNTYNLLRGDDDWDPQRIRERVEAISKRDGRDYANIATCLDMNLRAATIHTGGEELELMASLMRHVGYKLDNQEILWKVQRGYEQYVSLSASKGGSIRVKSLNDEDRTQVFNIYAYTPDGLEVAAELTAVPAFVEAPNFINMPSLKIENGLAVVDYDLALEGRKDESVVSWYRCDKSDGSGAVRVSVSRLGEPKKEYALSAGDAGKYIAVGVSPKHLRCEAGEEVRVVSKQPLRKAMLPSAKWIETDFADFSCDTQIELRPGYWTVDAYKPADTADYQWRVDLAQPCWYYGSGINGAAGYGLLQAQQGARLRYTPPKGRYGDMKVSWTVNPAKLGGQGFASARQQYLDLFVKFDTQTLTGYALRVIRTTKYANAVDVLLVRYSYGEVTAISESVTVDCFLTGCVLTVGFEDGMLWAEVNGPGRVIDLADDDKVQHSAYLQARVEANEYGGIGLQHTSTVGAESKLSIRSLRAEWE